MIAMALAGALGIWVGRRFSTAAPVSAIPTGAEPAGSRAELAAAQSRITALVAELEQATKQHQIEFGRLESGALAALDETIVQGQAREQELADDLEDSRSRLREAERQLDLLQRRFDSLQQSLAQRDARVAELNEQLSNQQGRRT